MANELFLVVWSLFIITLCKEFALSDNAVADEIAFTENKCCSETDTNCCVSLTYNGSISEAQDVPPEFGGRYYCENMVVKTENCGHLDYILIPVSTPCDFSRVLWDLRYVSSAADADGFIRAQLLVDDDIVLNNGDEFLLPPDDIGNPTDNHVLKFPMGSEPWNGPKRIIQICTQIGWGHHISNISGNEIEIGFSIDGRDRFKCANDTVRDICSIDTSSLEFDAESQALNVIHLHDIAHNFKGSRDDPRLDNFYNIFEHYWNEYLGLGIAVFAASVLFNIIMCLYRSGYNSSEYYTQETKIVKFVIDSDSDCDDSTEEESDCSDDYNY